MTRWLFDFVLLREQLQLNPLSTAPVTPLTPVSGLYQLFSLELTPNVCSRASNFMQRRFSIAKQLFYISNYQSHRKQSIRTERSREHNRSFASRHSRIKETIDMRIQNIFAPSDKHQQRGAFLCVIPCYL